jgi:hypothetical protein
MFYYEVKALGEQFRGRIVIVDTTVIIEPSEGACRGPADFIGARTLPPGIVAVRPPEHRGRKERVDFYCDLSAATSGKPEWTGAVVTIVVDRRSPTTHSEWGRQVPEQTGSSRTPRGLCVDPSGARDPGRCSRSIPVYTTRWSRLELTRDPPALPDSGAAGAAR